MITVISGTNRPNSKSLLIARYYVEAIRAAGENAQLIRLDQLPTDFMNNEMYGQRSEAFQNLLESQVRDVNKFVVVAGEYNGSFPGALKCFLDCVPPPFFHHSTVALVGLSAGHAGNLRGLDQLTGIFHYLKVEVLSAKPKLSSISNVLNDDDQLIDERAIEQIDQQIQKLIGISY